MNIHNRLTTVADCLTNTEEHPDYEANWLHLADRMFYERPCTDGSLHWSQAEQCFQPYDQEAEALDGYVVDNDGRFGWRDVAFALGCIGSLIAYVTGLSWLIERWRS